MNPLQASRYRSRLGVSGAKSDGGDAHMVADAVRTDAHQLRLAAGDSPAAAAAAVKVFARMHKRLIWKRERWRCGCGLSCWSTSPPRWSRSRTWTPRTHWSCWPGTGPGLRRETDPRLGLGSPQARVGRYKITERTCAILAALRSLSSASRRPSPPLPCAPWLQ